MKSPIDLRGRDSQTKPSCSNLTKKLNVYRNFFSHNQWMTYVFMITIVITTIAELMAKINCDLKTLLRVRFAIKKPLFSQRFCCITSTGCDFADKEFAQKRTCDD